MRWEQDLYNWFCRSIGVIVDMFHTPKNAFDVDSGTNLGGITSVTVVKPADFMIHELHTRGGVTTTQIYSRYWY